LPNVYLGVKLDYKCFELGLDEVMKRSTTLEVCKYLFKGINFLLHIFRKEQCNILKCKNRHGRIVNYKVKGMNKNLFFKLLEKDSMSLCNDAIIMDDNGAKHVLNEPKNMIIFYTRSYKGYEAIDGILANYLLPWI